MRPTQPQNKILESNFRCSLNRITFIHSNIDSHLIHTCNTYTDMTHVHGRHMCTYSRDQQTTYPTDSCGRQADSTLLSDSSLSPCEALPLTHKQRLTQVCHPCLCPALHFHVPQRILLISLGGGEEIEHTTYCVLQSKRQWVVVA
jgi:hypothetical protein